MPLVAKRKTTDEERRAVWLRTNGHCEIGDCRSTMNYVTTDGRAACGRCAAPPTASTGAGGW